MNENKMGKFIAEERKKKNMTQKALADKLYVTDRAVSKWERGLSYPDILLLEKISSILGVSVSELLSGEKIDNIDKNKADDIVKDSIAKYKKDVKKHLFRKILIRCLLIIVTAVILLIIFITLFTKYYKGGLDIKTKEERINITNSINIANEFMEALKNKDIETINKLLDVNLNNENPEIKEQNIKKYNSYLEDFYSSFSIVDYEYGYYFTNYAKLFTHEYTVYLKYQGQTIMHYIQIKSDDKNVYIHTIGYEDDDKISMDFIENNPKLWEKVKRVFWEYHMLTELDINGSENYKQN